MMGAQMGERVATPQSDCEGGWVGRCVGSVGEVRDEASSDRASMAERGRNMDGGVRFGLVLPMLLFHLHVRQFLLGLVLGPRLLLTADAVEFFLQLVEFLIGALFQIHQVIPRPLYCAD